MHPAPHMPQIDWGGILVKGLIGAFFMLIRMPGFWISIGILIGIVWMRRKYQV